MDLLRENSIRRWQWSAGSSGQNNRDNPIMTNNVGDASRNTNNSRLSQRQRPRRVSSMAESVDDSYTSAQSQGSALLEEWPSGQSDMDMDTDTDLNEMSLSSFESNKAVSFADYSRLHLYPFHEVERFKSYASTELKEFKTQVRLDVLRVEDLIANCPHEGGIAVCHLINSNALTPEELIGIDHLLCDADAGRKIALERFVHSKLVVRKQHQLHPQELADVARKKTLKNVKRALTRARLAELKTERDANTNDGGKLSHVNTVGSLKNVEQRRRSWGSAAA